MTLLVLALAGACLGQTRYEVVIDGKHAGYATMSQRFGADGTKSVDLRMELTAGGKKVVMRSQNTYDRTGVPTRKFLDANIAGGELQQQTVATFDARGANIVRIDGGKRTSRQIPLVEAAPRGNASEFWFERDQPKPGDNVRTYVFNMSELAWQLQTTYYRGRKSIKLGDREVSAHFVETVGDRPSKAYLDEKGIPWVVESGTTILKRLGN